MQTVTCVKCQKRYKLDPRLAGKTVKCKVCGHGMSIPALETVETGELDFAPSHHDRAPAKAPPPMPAKGPAKPAPRPKSGAGAKSNACPQCSAALPKEAKLCVSCGFNLVTGKKLATARDSAPSRPAILSRRSDSATRVGNRLAAPDPTVLPEACICCGKDEGVTMIQKTFNHIPLWAILLTGYVIGYFLFRKSATITFGLCKAHALQRNLMAVLALLLFLASLACFYFGVQGAPAALSFLSSFEKSYFFAAGGIGMLVAFLIGIFSPGLRVSSIDARGLATYRGAGKKFLEAL